MGNWGTAFDATADQELRARPDAQSSPGYLTLVDANGKVDASGAKVSAPEKTATGSGLSPDEVVTVGTATLV